jgi:hypothetical protein
VTKTVPATHKVRQSAFASSGYAAAWKDDVVTRTFEDLSVGMKATGVSSHVLVLRRLTELENGGRGLSAERQAATIAVKEMKENLNLIMQTVVESVGTNRVNQVARQDLPSSLNDLGANVMSHIEEKCTEIEEKCTELREEVEEVAGGGGGGGGIGDRGGGSAGDGGRRGMSDVSVIPSLGRSYSPLRSVPWHSTVFGTMATEATALCLRVGRKENGSCSYIFMALPPLQQKMSLPTKKAL